MSEAGYVELPILQWLSGLGSDGPTDQGLGWTYRDEAAMAAFERPLEDPLVEKLLIPALRKINKAVDTEDKAKLAVAALRKAMSHPDRLTANRETLDLLRDGARVQLEPGEDAKTVQFIAFDLGDQHLNDFTATNQYRLLVNLGGSGDDGTGVQLADDEIDHRDEVAVAAVPAGASLRGLDQRVEAFEQAV